MEPRDDDADDDGKDHQHHTPEIRRTQAVLRNFLVCVLAVGDLLHAQREQIDVQKRKCASPDRAERHGVVEFVQQREHRADQRVAHGQPRRDEDQLPADGIVQFHRRCLIIIYSVCLRCGR